MKFPGVGENEVSEVGVWKGQKGATLEKSIKVSLSKLFWRVAGGEGRDALAFPRSQGPAMPQNEKQPHAVPSNMCQ